MLDKKEELGQLIRTMRLSRNMTQSDLAKKIGQSQSSITMYETGRREPDFETMEALADAFNVPLHSLMQKDGEKYTAPKTLEARIVSYGMDSLPKEEREKILSILQTMYNNNPGLFKEDCQDADA